MNDANPETHLIELPSEGEQPEPESGESLQAAPAASDLEALQKELEQLRTQSQEYLDGWQRARAELANARKRFEKERAEAGQFANAELIRKLLPVSDDFERALALIPDDMRNQSWVEGITLIYRKLQATFESVGAQPIPVQPGDEFDPTLHEAITHEEAPNVASGTIIAQVQTGYRMGDNIIRPALVRVAK